MPCRNLESNPVIRTVAGIVCGALFVSVLWTARGLVGTTGTDKRLFLFGLMPAVTVLAASLAFHRFKTHRIIKIGILDMLIASGAVYLIINYYCFDSIVPAKLVTVLSLLILYYDLRIILSVFPTLKRIAVNCLLVLAVIEAILGLVQLFGWYGSYHPLFKITGTFLNPGPYAGYLAVLAPLASYRLLKPAQYGGRAIAWAAVCAVTAILFATESRTAWIALGVALAVQVCRETDLSAKLRLVWKRHKMYCWGGIFLLICAIIAGSFAMYRMKPASADGRLLMWKISCRIITDNPWCGVGFGNFKGAFAEQQVANFSSDHRPLKEQYAAGSPDFAFNEPLQVGVELGLVGLGIFMAIICLTLKGLTEEKNGLLYTAIALLIFSLASYPFNLLPFSILGVFLSAVARQKNVVVSPVRWPYRIGGIAFVIIFMFHAFVLRYGGRYYQAVRQWNLIQPAYLNGGQKSILPEYEKNKTFLLDESRFAAEYADCLYQAGYTKAAEKLMRSRMALFNAPESYILMARIYEAESDTAQAEAYFTKAMLHSPGRIYASYLLADFYCRYGRLSQGVNLARKTLDKRPKIISSRTKEIQRLLRHMIDNHMNVERQNES